MRRVLMDRSMIPSVRPPAVHDTQNRGRPWDRFHQSNIGEYASEHSNVCQAARVARFAEPWHASTRGSVMVTTRRTPG